MVQQKHQIVCSNILKNQIFRPNVLHQNFIKFNLFHLQVFFCWLRTILYILKSHFLMLDFYFLNQNQVSNNPNHQYLNLVCLAQYFMVEPQQEPARQAGQQPTRRLISLIPLFLLTSVFFDFLSPTIIIKVLTIEHFFVFQFHFIKINYHLPFLFIFQCLQLRFSKILCLLNSCFHSIMIFICFEHANVHAQFFHFCALFLLFHE